MSSYPVTVQQTSGLLHFWKCGEAGGGTATDVIAGLNGTYHNGVTQGAPSRIADYGDTGLAALLTYPTGYLEVPDDASLHLGDVFTFEMVTNRLTANNATNPLFYKAGQIDVALVSSKIEVVKPGTGLTARSSSTISDTGPHHVAVTKDGAGSTMRLYIDGVDVTATVNAHTYTDSASPLWWGANASFAGTIGLQYLAVYNRALSVSELHAHWASGFTFGPHPPEVPVSTRDAFPSTNFWNTPVRLGTSHIVRADSDALKGELLRQLTAYTPGLNTTSFTTPIVTVDESVPGGQVVIDHTGNYLDAYMGNVPIPANTRASAGQDGHLVIWRPSTHEMWELFQAGKQLFPPSGSDVTVSQTGGTLPAGTYSYNITSYNANGETLSKERTAVITSATGKVTYFWDVNTAAAGYRIYRSTTSGVGFLLATITDPSVHVYVDDGSVTPGVTQLPLENTADHTDGKWHASWGGYIPDTRTGKGYFDNPPFAGATATSLPLAGGLITVHELEDLGVIPHALGYALKDVKRESGAPAGSSDYLWPAQRSDGIYDGTPAIREGQWFVLDPALNLDAWNFNSPSVVPKMIAQALQTYGMVCRDRAGNLALYAEDPTNFGRVNPYKALYNGDFSNVFLSPTNFPWSYVIAVDANRQYFEQTGSVIAGHRPRGVPVA